LLFDLSLFAFPVCFPCLLSLFAFPVCFPYLFLNLFFLFLVNQAEGRLLCATAIDATRNDADDDRSVNINHYEQCCTPKTGRLPVSSTAVTGLLCCCCAVKKQRVKFDFGLHGQTVRQQQRSEQNGGKTEFWRSQCAHAKYKNPRVA
jgi:hypothetical protein